MATINIPMAAAIAGLVAAGLTLAVFGDSYTPFILTQVALATITGVGLNILLGLTGQVSFGHVGFFSIGAYTVAVLTLKGVSFWLALAAGGGLAGVLGALLALPALRVSGPYLAMMTIAFGFIVEHSAIEWRDVTGGQNGLAGIPQPSLGRFLSGESAIAAISVIIAGASLLLFDILARGSWGRSMTAVRDSEIAAASIGLRPVVVKTLAFSLSAIFTGVAGGCFAVLLAFVAPSAFPCSQSILFLLAVVIGGAGWTLGPVVGAAITVVLPELISNLAEYRLLIFGVLLLLVLWLAPAGIVGMLAKRFATKPRRSADGTRFDLGAFLAGVDRRGGLDVSGLSIAFGGIKAVSDAAFQAKSRQVTGLIGPNGAGKTTVLNLLSGFYKPDSGSIKLGTSELAGQSPTAIARAGIARTYQTTQLFGSLSVIENVLLGLRHGRLGNPIAPFANASDRAVAEGLLASVGYRGALDMDAASLAHVDRRLVEVARAVATRPSVLLLDEPAAGLTISDKSHLGGVLRALADVGMAVVLVEHDMTLVMGLCDHIVALDAGRPIASGLPATIRAHPQVMAAYLGSGQVVLPPRTASLDPAAAIVLSARALDAGYGAITVLYGVSLEVKAGEMVALLGPNGAGKSTTMRALSGLLRPIRGGIQLGPADISNAPAHRIARSGLALVPEGRQVFPELTVRDNLELGAYTSTTQNTDAAIDKVLQRFPRLRERIDQRAGLLSGGEAQMLAIGRGLMSEPRILLLDEPSLGLAPAIVEELYLVLAELRNAGVTVLLVDQMATLALTIADRGYVIASGAVVQAGAAAALANDPALKSVYLGQAKTSA